MIKKIRHITRNRKNRNLAMPAAATAMPVNPNREATSATTRKISAQRNIMITSQRLFAGDLVRACAVRGQPLLIMLLLMIDQSEQTASPTELPCSASVLSFLREILCSEHWN